MDFWKDTKSPELVLEVIYFFKNLNHPAKTCNGFPVKILQYVQCLLCQNLTRSRNEELLYYLKLWKLCFSRILAVTHTIPGNDIRLHFFKKGWDALYHIKCKTKHAHFNRFRYRARWADYGNLVAYLTWIMRFIGFY